MTWTRESAVQRAAEMAAGAHPGGPPWPPVVRCGECAHWDGACALGVPEPGCGGWAYESAPAGQEIDPPEAASAPAADPIRDRHTRASNTGDAGCTAAPSREGADA